MASDELMQAILAGPPGATAAEPRQAKPLGVPETFVPAMRPYIPDGPVSPGQAERRSAAAQPRAPYFDGAQYAPRSLSPEARARIQTAMAQAGLIGERQTYRLGVWDEVSSDAFKKVLEYANQGGIDADTALEELLQAQQYDGTGALTGGLEVDHGRVTATTSRLDVQAQIQAAARERLGRKLPDSQASKFAAIYERMEKGYSSRALAAEDAAAMSGQDSSIEEIPSVSVAADQYIDSTPELAQEAAGESAYGYLGALKSMLGG